MTLETRISKLERIMVPEGPFIHLGVIEDYYHPGIYHQVYAGNPPPEGAKVWTEAELEALPDNYRVFIIQYASKHGEAENE